MEATLLPLSPPSRRPAGHRRRRRWAAVPAVAVLTAAAFTTPAVGHHPTPVFPPGGPRLVDVHDRLRDANVRAGHRVFRAYRPGTPWVLVRRRTHAYWRNLRRPLIREHRMRAHWPYPDWWVRYGARVVSCESGGRDDAVSPGGTYRGRWQFDVPTWRSVGGTGDPARASRIEQDHRAYVLWSLHGAGRWPVCGRLFGS